MVPLTEVNQDQWTFLWKEGYVIHCQCWDRGEHFSDDYMGNVSFNLDIKRKGVWISLLHCQFVFLLIFFYLHDVCDSCRSGVCF